MTKDTTKRTTRKPLFNRGPQSVCGDKDPDYQYRFVNDVGSRIHNFKEAGYELVTDTDVVVGDTNALSIGEFGSARRVISNDGTTSYLMRTKKEFFEEDQKAKSKLTNELEATTQETRGMYGSVKLS